MTELQENSIENLRSTIVMNVSPFLELLEGQKKHISQTQWLHAVRTLMSRILENPDQYLKQDLPPKDVTTAIVRSIFHEYIMKHTPFPMARTQTRQS